MTVGEFLRKTREGQKLTLQQVSEKTNIRVKYLEAIESGDLSIIPSLSQARGFTRLYASFLGLNPLDVFEKVQTNENKVDGIQENIPETSQNKEIIAKNEIPAPGDDSVSSAKKPVSLSDEIFTNIGMQLRQQREKLGLSRDDVERQTKIREFYLYALEEGDIDSLPSTVQGRGMLINYASFLSLDSNAFQSRYAEGLQRRRMEKLQIEEVQRKRGKSIVGKEPLTGWRKLLTPDLIVGGGLFISLFILVLWGAYQVIRTGIPENVPTIESISNVLIGTEQSATENMGMATESTFLPTETMEMETTPLVDLQATITAMQQGPIQVVIYAHQRAYVSVTVDGRNVFTGRVAPGNVYSYSGSQKISILTGNAGGLQLYYNQQDLGILGQIGQVENIEFTIDEMATATPRFTPTATQTSLPTLTPLPTRTSTPTVVPPTPTITPLVP
jgi:cytoskeletal protein RodZ